MLLKGILLWPNITPPGTTEFSKDQYSLDLSLDEKTARNKWIKVMVWLKSSAL